MLQLIAILCVIVVNSRDANAIQATRNATTAAASTTGSTTPGRDSKLVFHDSEGDAKQLLAELGFKRNPMAVITRAFFNPITFVVIVALLTIVALAADYTLAKKHNMQLNVGTRVLAISVLLAVFQWHSSLEQDAMQRYEAEVTNANAAEASEAVAKMLPTLYLGQSPDEHAQSRYVYIHLDNLEYAIERYRHGFASATTTERAVMTFAVHCKEPVFSRLAQQQVNGYSNDVHAVVKAVVKNL
ncbi:MAG TPA: hypothetical protein VGQ46_20800 [Thermoanaerobaculia bacterium]|jgi:mRNA-degrading endonuclease toxin of MazEF toxin-antitoxin module|nr:hypothetical protein [Thermoanaerobaculia bacterium]